MATKTPSHSSSRPKKKPASKQNKTARATTGRAAAKKKSGRAPSGLRSMADRMKPPLPEQVVAAVREKLERLGSRWKNLLPRLKKSSGAKPGKKRAASRKRGV